MLTLSRRARELGTENAFVVLGEVAALQAAGKEIVSFAIGQPDFPTPDHIRISYANSRENLQLALERIADTVAKVGAGASA